MSRFIGVIFVLFCLMFMYIGGSQALEQDRKIRTFQPVQAVVLSTDIVEHVSRNKNGSKSYSYEPVVSYQYEVQGLRHQSRTVLPIKENSSHAWASGIVAKFPVGSKVQAYADPSNPGDAFLIRVHSYTPYLFVQFPLVFALVGFAVMGDAGTAKARSPQALPEGGFQLMPSQRILWRVLKWALASAVFVGIVLGSNGHYFLNEASPSQGAYITAAIALAGCMIPVGLFVYALMLWQAVQEPLVMTDTDLFVLGEAVTLLVEMPAKQDFAVEMVTARLSCTEETRERQGGKWRDVRRDIWSSEHTLLQGQNVRAGESVSGMQSFAIPKDEPATKTSGPHPRYHWQFDIQVRIAGKPDYHGQFPILVRPG